MIRIPHKRRRMKQPRIAIWLQYYDYNTRAECDTIIAYCKQHRVTDLFCFVQDDGASPKTVMGYSDLCNQTATTWDGVLPFYYLCREANRINVKVHATWVIYPWTFWGGTTACLVTPLVDNATNHDTSSGGSTINFNTGSVRTTVINAIKEFARLNPRCAGINLDYIRTDGVVTTSTTADVTSFVDELRIAVKDRELSVCALSTYYDPLNYKQDVDSWTDNDFIDTVAVMAYYTSAPVKMWYWDRCKLSNKTLMVGIGTEESSSASDFNCTRPSDTSASLRQYFDLGYENFCIFCWGDNMDATNRQDELDGYLFGDPRTLAAYPAVTSVTVTPDTSISLIIGGSTYTTNHADVTDHTTTGTLKQHIELVEGRRPWIHYQRPTSSTIRVQVGDWEL